MTSLNSPRPFDHEKLHVYAAALDFVALTHQMIASMPAGRGRLADQLERAATSIVLNIAEGSGEFSAKEKARFYRIGLRSAAECAAALDVGWRTNAIDASNRIEGKRMLTSVAAMLVGLIRRHEQR